MSSINIGLTLYPGCIPSGLFASAELMQAANQLSGKKKFVLHWVSTQSNVETGVSSNERLTESDLKLHPNQVLGSISLDELLIPGMWIQSMEELQNILSRNSDLVEYLTSLDSKTRINAYCSSVSFLAMSGRLKHQSATSTWWLANFYTEQFPEVVWDFNCSFVEGTNFTCASGVNGHLPIAMHLIEKYLGKKILREVTKVMLLPRPEALQPTFQKVDRLSLTDPLMRKVLIWTEKMPADDVNSQALAKEMNVAERTLARRIKKHTGESTKSFMRLIKLNQASEALILSNNSISVISETLGFSDDRTFRRAFKRETGYTPGDYRETFKRPDFGHSETI